MSGHAAAVANATVAKHTDHRSSGIPTFIFQSDEGPAPFHREVRQYLNTVLPLRWIGRASGNDQALVQWSSRSPDITPCCFGGEGYVNDGVFVPPLPRDLAALKARVTVAAQNTDAPMLTRVWQELE